MGEQTTTRLKTALDVVIETTAPNDRGEVVLRLTAALFDDETFTAWLTPEEARQLAGQLNAQAALGPLTTPQPLPHQIQAVNRG